MASCGKDDAVKWLIYKRETREVSGEKMAGATRTRGRALVLRPIGKKVLAVGWLATVASGG